MAEHCLEASHKHQRPPDGSLEDQALIACAAEPGLGLAVGTGTLAVSDLPSGSDFFLLKELLAAGGRGGD